MIRTCFFLVITSFFTASALPTKGQDVGTVHAALTALYKSTDGGNWTDNSGWDTTAVPASMQEFNSWYGLFVTDDNILSEVVLSSNNLTGSLPSELGDLSDLYWLALSHNQLTGNVPREIGGLSNLRWLDLSYNQLTDALPSEMGMLTELEHLWLHENQFTGQIPSEFGHLINLVALGLKQNQLTGEIPSDLGNLLWLKWMWLDENLLTGRIPADLGNLPNLEILELDHNELTGSIPAEMGSLTKLTTLDLSFNQISGEIPSEIGQLSVLQGLWLDINQLTGEVPSEIGNMAKLNVLGLSRNQLTGTLPRTLLQLQGLDVLQFWSNMGLCAPPDDEFQNWLNTIHTLNGPNCVPAVSVEHNAALPTQFAVRGNYPNPFRTSTRLRFDLPHPARVSVEIFDVTGRRVYVQAPTSVSAGFDRELPLRELGQPSGTYLYRLTVNALEGQGESVHTGSFVRVK